MLPGRDILFFKKFSAPSFQKIGLVGTLCIINIALIIFLGGLMVLLSGHTSFLFWTFLITASAGSTIIFLLVRLEKLNLSTPTQQLEAMAYEKLSLPLLILTPDFQFIYANKKAQRDCWWGASIAVLKSSLRTTESQEALGRLLDALSSHKDHTETLAIIGEKGKETWRIHSLPLGGKALWQCHPLKAEEGKNESSTGQLKIITSLMDSASDGVFSINEKGIILFCNEKFAKWLGYAREDMIGALLVKFLSPAVAQENVNPLDLQGKCDFITSSSRTKSIFLDQTKIPFGKGFITYSLAYLHTPFDNQSDLSRVLNMSPHPVICLDEKGHIQDSNFLFRDQFWPAGLSTRGASFLDFIADSAQEDAQNAFHSFLNGKDDINPIEIPLKDARESIVAAYFATLSLENRKGVFVQLIDITEQKRIESQLVQSQKMQAVGQLAGGIAHDFNNLLTAMIGFCDLLLLRHTPGDQSFTDVMQIKQNANRAANLVRQLLAFSRQQTLQPKVIDITESLAELSALLRRLIGSNIELKIKHGRDLWLVLVDQIQLEQVIINLAVNARDAMEGDGSITITTQNYELKKAKRYGHEILPAGSYVLIEISDTGAGIKSDNLDRIFDPFFSTKEVGSGTGLGLSTVYGIVKQTGGFIQVSSQLGKGTTFSIYLPRCKPEETKTISPLVPEKPIPQDLSGSSTILLVEDEDAVRLFSARALRSKGYKVMEAVNGADALEFMKSTPEKIDLIISDVAMPQMNGPTFINKITELGISPKVLFISGYTEDTFESQLRDDEKVSFLPKPFSLSDLAVRVKEILEEKPHK